MRGAWILGGCLLMGGLFACGPGTGGGGVEVENIDGVEYVHNPADPLNPGGGPRFEEDLSIEAEDEEGNIRFYRPAALLVDRNDNIYVADYRDAVIRVFAPDGKYIRTIGRKGQGPGENQVITQMAWRPDERLLVFDHRSRRSSLFDRLGNFLSSHPWKQSHFELFWADESGYLTEETVFGEEPTLMVKKFDWEGGEIETWGEFNPYRMHVERSGGSAISIGIPYAPRSIFAGDGERGRLYHCFNQSYRIEVYDGPSRLMRVIDRPYQRVPFTSEDADEYYASVDRRNNPSFSELARKVDLPDEKTVTDGMRVDDLGFLWIETQETRVKDGIALRAYDVFDPDGLYQFRIWLEFTPGLIARGGMYRVHRDEETGSASIKRYRVIRQ